MKLSIVIPCYHSEKSIERVISAIQASAPLTTILEFVLVNDGSKDGTWKKILELYECSDQIRAVNLTRNFGEHNAVMMGLRYVTGDFVVITDDDLQHPAQEVFRLVEELVQGRYDVIYGKYLDRKHSWFRRMASGFHGKLANLCLNKPRDLYLSSFKAMTRKLADELVHFDGPHVYLDGLIFWVTQNVGELEVRHAPRAIGKSNYSLRKLAGLHSTMVIEFSVIPLRWMGGIGFLSVTLGILYSVISLTQWMLNPQISVSEPATIILVLMIGGMILMGLGLVGEYLGRLLLIVNRKPLAVVREAYLEKSASEGCIESLPRSKDQNHRGESY